MPLLPCPPPSSSLSRCFTSALAVMAKRMSRGPSTSSRMADLGCPGLYSRESGLCLVSRSSGSVSRTRV